MPIAPIMLFLAAAAPAPAGTERADDPDRVICRSSAPAPGSRVARQRTCRTLAEWRAFEADRAQMRRDLNAGNCNGDRSCSELSASQRMVRTGPR